MPLTLGTGQPRQGLLRGADLRRICAAQQPSAMQDMIGSPVLTADVQLMVLGIREQPISDICSIELVAPKPPVGPARGHGLAAPTGRALNLGNTDDG